MEEVPAPTTRETVTDLLATTAHIFDSYPRSVEAIGALVIEHLDQDAATSGYTESAEGTPDEAMARFQRVFGAASQDPRLREIKTRLEAEYLPPPYRQLPPAPGEAATSGEPLTLAAIGAVLAAGAAVGVGAYAMHEAGTI